jgi:hypothetical protein
MRHEPTIAMLFNFGLESLMYLENKLKKKIRSERSVACLELCDVKQVYILCCVYIALTILDVWRPYLSFLLTKLNERQMSAKTIPRLASRVIV